MNIHLTTLGSNIPRNWQWRWTNTTHPNT